jgi:hypothetical protein
LNSNNITVVPDFGETCYTLLKLNLSNAPICLHHADSEENLRKLTRLRSLTLQSCNISRISRCEPGGRNEQQETPQRCSLSSLVLTLECLDLSFNNIEDFEEIMTLGCLKRLVNLNISCNPMENMQNYSECARKLCLKLSTLKSFNGSGYKHGMKTAQFADIVARETGMGEQAGDDSSSCSCIEGNPCVVSYNCRNWARRYEIAKANGWKGF